MNYMMGAMLSTDTSFLEMLATAHGAGKQINADVARGIADNIQLVTDEATNTITGNQEYRNWRSSQYYSCPCRKT